MSSPQSLSNYPATSAGSNAGGRSRTCRFCSKRFSKTEHLLRHERSHTKERPYTCGVCQKSFGRNDTLLRHKRAHSKRGDDMHNPTQYGGAQVPANSDPIQNHSSNSNDHYGAVQHQQLQQNDLQGYPLTHPDHAYFPTHQFIESHPVDYPGQPTFTEPNQVENENENQIQSPAFGMDNIDPELRPPPES